MAKRYIGTVAGYKKAVKPRYVWEEGEAKADMIKLENIIIISDIVEYDTGAPVGCICEMYAESKAAYNANCCLFLGNKIAFDAIEKDGKLTRVNNICGKNTTLNFIDDNLNLKAGAIFKDYCTCSVCISCKHWDWQKEKVKPSCSKNRLKE